jgi:hypothetical protein
MRAHHERNLWFGEPDFSCRFHRTVISASYHHETASSHCQCDCDRRAAVLLERGRVQYAITDRLALLALKNALADFLGVKLQAHVRPPPAACRTIRGSAPCTRAAERARRRGNRLARSPTNRARRTSQRASCSVGAQDRAARGQGAEADVPPIAPTDEFRCKNRFQKL